MRKGFLEEAMFEVNTEQDEESIRGKGIPVWKKITNTIIMLKQCGR